MFTIFYNKPYMSSCYWYVKKNVSIMSKLELVTVDHLGFVVKLL